jgi:hypothetical protein
MTIEFTQFLRPDGRRKKVEIDLDSETEALAKKFVDSGGWFECEVLTDESTVSLTACRNIDGEPDDIVIVLVENGPKVPDAVYDLVRKAIKHGTAA